MFSFDGHIDDKEMSRLAENWSYLGQDARGNIAAVFHRGQSEEFYRGVTAALFASARLMTDKSFPESDKPIAVKGALGYVATRIITGNWPK